MGNRITANGVDTYYERQGSGEPLLLLHGGFGSSADFASHIPTLAAHFDVIAPDRRGHGRTPDAGAISYDVIADDTIAFMDALGIESAHVVGYSDGGNVGLLLASGSPGRVRKLVAISANFRADGVSTESRAFFENTPAADAPDPFIEAYAALSPDGREHFPIVYEKIRQMILNEPQIPTETLGKIGAPMLVMCADDDMILLDHTIELFRAIPGAQLSVIPGASHLAPFEKPELLLQIVTTFLLETESTKIAMM